MGSVPAEALGWALAARQVVSIWSPILPFPQRPSSPVDIPQTAQGWWELLGTSLLGGLGCAQCFTGKTLSLHPILCMLKFLLEAFPDYPK